VSPLARQRLVIVLVLGAALVLAVIALLRSTTSPGVKVVLVGLLAGLAIGGLLAARRGPS